MSLRLLHPPNYHWKRATEYGVRAVIAKKTLPTSEEANELTVKAIYEIAMMLESQAILMCVKNNAELS